MGDPILQEAINKSLARSPSSRPSLQSTALASALLMNQFMDAIGFLFVVSILLFPVLWLFVYFSYKLFEEGFRLFEFKDQRKPLED